MTTQVRETMSRCGDRGRRGGRGKGRGEEREGEGKERCRGDFGGSFNLGPELARKVDIERG